ncbi:hypothetical protein BGZ70_006180 [Mortierella alpina]|uniref:Uncharacterized protein n=1 Tax=Mortierella alpina TaxID=64518 RepID=A0A9P6J8A2_MORAP|nr:hypothetical protein BGZ70_006180 [Mortierella alpina]
MYAQMQTQQQQQQVERVEPELDYRHALYRPLSTPIQDSLHASGNADETRSMSTLVNMSIPRSIPATTAVRMLKTSIKILMYMRGQMGSTWEQLERQLRLELLEDEYQEEEEEEAKKGSTSILEPSAGSSGRRMRSREDVLRTKSLQKFIQNGERIFVDLEGAIHSRLLINLRSGIDAPSLYLTLAVIFGSTVTTPKEQYMIRIGPLEPQEPLSTPIQTSLPSDIPTPQMTHTIPADAEECSSTQADPLGKRKREHQHGHEKDLERSSKESREQQHGLRLKEQRWRRQEEMQWERKLFQDIMGLSLVDDQPLSALGSEVTDAGAAQSDNIVHSPVLTSRTKVHVLMKAPQGRIFDGLFPKQMLSLKEDYSIDTIEEQRSLEQETTPTAAAAAAVGAMSKKKKARWPIHHLHILGPSTSSKEPLRSMPLSRNAGPPSTPTPPLHSSSGSDAPEDEIWYQIGSDIPVLSSLL